MNFFSSKDVEPFIEAYQYQAILDAVTTQFCQEHDGQIIKSSDPNFATIVPPNHYNCRSTLVPIMVEETNIINEEITKIDDVNLEARLEELGDKLGIKSTDFTIKHKNFNVTINLDVVMDVNTIKEKLLAGPGKDGARLLRTRGLQGSQRGGGPARHGPSDRSRCRWASICRG